MDANEIWKDIPGYGGYQASNLGRIRSWRGQGGGHVDQPHILASNGSRRPMHLLRQGGKSVAGSVGKFVALAFIGPRPEGQVLRHLNDVPGDNRVENLCYGTQAENLEDARRNGRLHIGDDCPLSKLTSLDVIEIRQAVASGVTPRELAPRYGVSEGTICDAARGRTWKHLPGAVLVQHVSREAIAEMLDLYWLQHKTQQEIADRFRIHIATASYILRGLRRQRHLELTGSRRATWSTVRDAGKSMNLPRGYILALCSLGFIPCKNVRNYIVLDLEDLKLYLAGRSLEVAHA